MIINIMPLMFQSVIVLKGISELESVALNINKDN